MLAPGANNGLAALDVARDLDQVLTDGGSLESRVATSVSEEQVTHELPVYITRGCRLGDISSQFPNIARHGNMILVAQQRTQSNRL
eukprot:106728-Prorocentrum_minimum.AAC.1